MYLHPAPCTLHPAPCTLHPAPCTPAPLHPCNPALRKLDLVVDEFWAEISDSIQTIEVAIESLILPVVIILVQVVSEDKLYPEEVRQQAALVASKVGSELWHRTTFPLLLSHHDGDRNDFF
jgi:hypothetical protein